MKKIHFLCILLISALFLETSAPLTVRAADDMKVEAKSALLADYDHGEVLFEQDARERRYPASITKVMTALLTLEAIDRGELSLAQEITASETHTKDLRSGGSTQNIKPGEVLTVEQLLYCALVASANEACNILAEAVSGSLGGFADLMNERAGELGMENTHYENAHGLHNENHYTTAYDIYLLAAEAMKNETFRTMVATAEYKIPETNLYKARHFYSTNALLSNWNYVGYTYNRAIGIKTGSTPEAGECLVSAAVQNGRTLVAVVLGAQTVTGADGALKRMYFLESRRLLQWGFSDFSRKTILDEKTLLGEIPVTLSQEANYVVVHPSGTLEATLLTALDPALFERELKLAEEVEAPVGKGQVLGTVTISHEGTVYGTLDLVAANDVSRSELLYRIDRVKKFFAQTWAKLVIAAVVVLVVALIIYLSIFRRRRHSRRRHSSGGYAGGGRRRY